MAICDIHLPQSTYVTTISLVIHPLSSKSVPSRGVFHFSQYSCAFFYVGYTSLLFYYTFCGLVTYVASFSFLFFFSISIFGHFHLECSTPQYLKHCTPFFTVFYFFTFTSSFTLHCIILFAIISNLFWEISFLFISSFLFLQLQTRCLNFLHSQYTFPSLPPISALSLARVYHWLSIPFMRELY